MRRHAFLEGGGRMQNGALLTHWGYYRRPGNNKPIHQAKIIRSTSKQKKKQKLFLQTEFWCSKVYTDMNQRQGCPPINRGSKKQPKYQTGLEERQLQNFDCALGTIAWVHIFTALESALTPTACYAATTIPQTVTTQDNIPHCLIGQSVSDTGRLG